jgi:hypothetical protein
LTELIFIPRLTSKYLLATDATSHEALKRFFFLLLRGGSKKSFERCEKESEKWLYASTTGE